MVRVLLGNLLVSCSVLMSILRYYRADLPSLGPGAVHGWASHAWRVCTSAWVGKAQAEDTAADRPRVEENLILDLWLLINFLLG
jgi:hypothetical protein